LDRPIPHQAWRRRFDQQPPKRTRPIGFSLKMLATQLPFLYRFIRHAGEEKRRKQLPVMNMAQGARTGADMGVPLGGLGGGTVTRGWRGDFNRWQLQPGIVEYRNVPANQFSVWAQRADQAPACQVLNPNPGPKGCLQAWAWGLPAHKGIYHALFPRAWTVYEEALPGLRLTCRQVSPVIPHNYQESSTPAGVFVWTVENTGVESASVALMFTFQNGSGGPNDLQGGHTNHLVQEAGREGEILALELRHIHRQARTQGIEQSGHEQARFEDPLTFAIAMSQTPEVTISYQTRFRTKANGADLWGDFAADGRLDNLVDPAPALPGESIGAALAARTEVPAGEVRQVVFALAWDMPVARFGDGTGWYRRYTRFYGRDGQAAARIARDALLHYPDWEARIEAWQQPVLDNAELPDWYKTALFNETYYLVDGGTIWTAGQQATGSLQNDPLPEADIGHFAYLESHEYRLYNTLDVHFNASFALALLWPDLELSLMRDFIHSLEVEDLRRRTIWHSGEDAPRKLRGMLPHDLGSPVADPWRELNAYQAQDISRWKDLNSKFVLLLYRDTFLTRDQSFLAEAYPAARQATEHLARFDKDGDGLIENEGFPDQTYDTWTMSGPSAHCGGLWLACLSAMEAMAAALGRHEEADGYRKHLERAQQAFEARLWNGAYYNFDSSPGKHRAAIMADQLAGHWFAQACGLPGVVPSDRARSAYQKIFAFNVEKAGEGQFGALNGMRPDGQVDQTSLQSEEMWIGTTYCLAAGMLQEGLGKEAFATARGAYKTIYQDYGLWFRTPEAITLKGVHRAVGYMRPLAIWAMQWALEKGRTDLQSN